MNFFPFFTTIFTQAQDLNLSLVFCYQINFQCLTFYFSLFSGRSSKRQSSKTKKDRKAKMTPNQTAASPALPASLPTPPASVAISNNSWSISSEDDLPKEDSDDETKDQSYGVGAKYKKSPTKGRGKKIATPQRNHEVNTDYYFSINLFIFSFILNHLRQFNK